MKLFDTNALIYSFDTTSTFHAWAKAKLSASILKGEALVNPVILAELAVGDTNPSSLPDRLRGLGIALIDLPWESAEAAASAFADYLQARILSGNPSSLKTPLPDFFIGAHAKLLSCPIVTVDVQRYQTYFPTVELIHPV
ncbi:MAG: PIN domain-containing protein [Verrucomicrobia bacterium]|nr:PIN domain-containing protein [Verrucomicrobiota bacterium]MCH8513236.1 PIN domain-containing protein [Kiritimatiellia bacterium]